MKKILILACILLLAGCSTDATGKKVIDQQAVSTGTQVLRGILAAAQMGYADYALITQKTQDPNILIAGQTIDSQLDLLGKMVANIGKPTQVDIDAAKAALAAVEAAKAQIPVPVK